MLSTQVLNVGRAMGKAMPPGVEFSLRHCTILVLPKILLYHSEQAMTRGKGNFAPLNPRYVYSRRLPPWC